MTDPHSIPENGMQSSEEIMTLLRRYGQEHRRR